MSVRGSLFNDRVNFSADQKRNCCDVQPKKQNDHRPQRSIRPAVVVQEVQVPAKQSRCGWRELCLAVTNESDSTKLTSLVQNRLRHWIRVNEAGVTPFPRLTQSRRIGKPPEIKSKASRRCDFASPPLRAQPNSHWRGFHGDRRAQSQRLGGNGHGDTRSDSSAAGQYALRSVSLDPGRDCKREVREAAIRSSLATLAGLSVFAAHYSKRHSCSDSLRACRISKKL